VAVKNQAIHFLAKKAKILRCNETAKKTHSEADYSSLQQIIYAELQHHNSLKHYLRKLTIQTLTKF
jgi:hypothetical protein